MFFLKLYYKLLDWEWYTNANVFRLFIHCLLKANRQTKKWQGYTIERGSFITSYPHLAKELGLSQQQIRTALNKLKLTGEITHKQQGSNSLIIVNNYSQYQPSNTVINREITDEQQTVNREITPTIECKNVYSDKNDISINAETAKKTDPYTNPLVFEFKRLYKQKFGKSVYLDNAQVNRLTELAAVVDDFGSTMPTVMDRLKNIKWTFADGRTKKADINWLLSDSNYTKVLNSEIELSKQDVMDNWLANREEKNDESR